MAQNPIETQSAKDHEKTPSRGTELPQVTVEATVPETLTTLSPEQAQQNLNRLPGGTTLIEAEAFHDGFAGCFPNGKS